MVKNSGTRKAPTSSRTKRVAKDGQGRKAVSRAPKKTKPPRKRGWNYPRRGYGRIHRWLPSWRVMLSTIFAMFGLVFGTIGTIYVTTEIPEPGDFALAQTTTVYYSDGVTEMGTFADYQRESVPLSSVPIELQHAVVASEDASFYSNSGISVRGIIRALVNNVKGGSQQGGSTLTQQYVERYYLGTTKGYVGKLKEAVLAVKINRQQSKDQILENYLNTIYFGRGAYGVETAAQKYFGTSVSELNLSQSALLVAIIPAPSSSDPAVDPDKALERWQRVLNRMVSEGYITQEEADAQTFPATIPPSTANAYAGTNGYLLAAVSQELINSGQFTEDDLSQRGLKIVTTIDPVMQQAAVDAVDALPEDRPENNYVGLVSVDPRNGEIYAMYGGADYLTRQRNAVTQDRAQAGSTFKPFTLLAALEQGVTLSATYDSTTPKSFGAIEVVNFDDISRGRVDLVTATKYSINTAYVGLNEDIGPANTMAAAVQVGIPEETPGLDDSLTNVLGSASPRAIDMAKAYSTFANEGVTVTPHIVRSVSNANGVIYTGTTEGERTIDVDTANSMNYALQAVTTSGATGETAGSLGRPVAGKTGTSSDTKSAWFIGYVPQMVTVVNMYQVGPNGEEESLTPFGRYTWGIGGGSFPAEIWLRYMEVATDGMDVMEFTDPISIPRQPTPSPTVTEEPTEEPTTEEPTTPPMPAPTPTTITLPPDEPTVEPSEPSHPTETPTEG